MMLRMVTFGFSLIMTHEDLYMLTENGCKRIGTGNVLLMLPLPRISSMSTLAAVRATTAALPALVAFALASPSNFFNYMNDLGVLEVKFDTLELINTKRIWTRLVPCPFSFVLTIKMNIYKR